MAGICDRRAIKELKVIQYPYSNMRILRVPHPSFSFKQYLSFEDALDVITSGIIYNLASTIDYVIGSISL